MESWSFGNGKSIYVVHTNDVYHKLVEDRAWLENKVLDTWSITRNVKWWRRVLDVGWQSQLPFRAKVFLWRAIVGGLPLAMALKRRHISNGTCFFCTVAEEDARHRFITCSVAKAIWVIMSQIWASITGNILSPYKWVFMDEDKVMPTPSYKVVFYYLRYWGMWFNWTMRNEFLFDGLHGIAQQIRRMKGKLIWQFSQLCCMGILSQEEIDLCHLVLQHLRGFPLHYHYL